MATLSKTRIDKLGDRLRRGSSTDTDLRELDLYRKSFASAYDVVIRRIRDELRLEPTGRPAKSTSSIVDKLQRESIRLSQIQDIAGCRLLLDDILAQDRAVEAIQRTFTDAKVTDRRAEPSHGYRAVHVVVGIDDRSIEFRSGRACSTSGQSIQRSYPTSGVPKSNMGSGANRFART
jgi:putative GTP pyrophosphokinase